MIFPQKGGGVFPFLSTLSVFEVSQELGIPTTPLTQTKIKKEFRQLKLKLRNFETELDLVSKRWARVFMQLLGEFLKYWAS